MLPNVINVCTQEVLADFEVDYQFNNSLPKLSGKSVDQLICSTSATHSDLLLLLVLVQSLLSCSKTLSVLATII